MRSIPQFGGFAWTEVWLRLRERMKEPSSGSLFMSASNSLPSATTQLASTSLVASSSKILPMRLSLAPLLMSMLLLRASNTASSSETTSTWTWTSVAGPLAIERACGKGLLARIRERTRSPQATARDFFSSLLRRRPSDFALCKRTSTPSVPRPEHRLSDVA